MRWSELPIHSHDVEHLGAPFLEAFLARVVGQTVTGVRLHAELLGTGADPSWPFRTQGSESMSAAVTLTNGSTLVVCRNWSGADLDLCTWLSVHGDATVTSRSNLYSESLKLPAPLEVTETTPAPAWDAALLEGRQIVRLISALDSDYLEVSGGLLLQLSCSSYVAEPRARARILRFSGLGEARVVASWP